MDKDTIEGEWGMTLRDYFAAAAMTGFLSNPGLRSDVGNDSAAVAATAYNQADAMLAERGK